MKGMETIQEEAIREALEKELNKSWFKLKWSYIPYNYVKAIELLETAIRYKIKHTLSLKYPIKIKAKKEEPTIRNFRGITIQEKAIALIKVGDKKFEIRYIISDLYDEREKTEEIILERIEVKEV